MSVFYLSGGDRGLGQTGVWSDFDTLPADDALTYAAEVESLGYGTLWVPDVVGREPFTLLGLLAGATSSIGLGTSIVSIWGRDAQATRMAACTLQEATGGRFTLGLGVSHLHLAQKLRGHTYERPVTRMREYLAAYRSAIYKGPMPDGMREPLVLVAALRERMLTLAATEADGAFPYLVTPERLAWMRGVLGASGPSQRPVLAVSLPCVLETDPDTARATGRAYLTHYLRTPNYRAAWVEQGFEERDWDKPGSDRLVDAMVAWGDADTLRGRLGEMLTAGADHVAIVPVAPDGDTVHLPVLEALAG
ncbi:MAG: TIGR03620 family F420-dependent LLM class oxidoreductase [Candidatus Limnocylindria bacterium]